ncbi:MAG: hypothetical protein SOT60_06750 [Bilifractor sp.]|nr:hypothetical protein [Bilifractor sp.]
MDGKTFVQICLNEAEKTVEDMDGEIHTEYEYDFNEFAEESPDVDAIKINPEKYLDYQPPKEQTDKQRIATLESQLSQTQAALQDLIMMEG